MCYGIVLFCFLGREFGTVSGYKTFCYWPRLGILCKKLIVAQLIKLCTVGVGRYWLWLLVKYVPRPGGRGLPVISLEGTNLWEKARKNADNIITQSCGCNKSMVMKRVIKYTGV